MTDLAAHLEQDDLPQLVERLAALQPVERSVEALCRAAVAAAREAWTAWAREGEECPLATLRRAERELLTPVALDEEPASDPAAFAAQMNANLIREVFRRANETLAAEAQQAGDAAAAAAAASAWYASQAVAARLDVRIGLAELGLDELDAEDAGELLIDLVDPAQQALLAAASCTDVDRVRARLRAELLPWLTDAADPLAARVAEEGDPPVRSPRVRELAERTLQPAAIALLNLSD